MKQFVPEGLLESSLKLNDVSKCELFLSTAF